MFLSKCIRCLFVRHVKPFRFRGADVIILAQSFGQREKPEEDTINKALADVVRKEHEETHLDMILQHEVAYHVKDLAPKIISQHRIPGKYLDTYEVLMQSYQHGLKNAFIVAHPDHAWRVVMTAKKIGFNVTGVADTRHIGYDPLSLQWWTRSRARFITYDTAARFIYLYRGWL